MDNTLADQIPVQECQHPEKNDIVGLFHQYFQIDTHIKIGA